MARGSDSPEIVFSGELELPDGRKVRVLAYADGSVRFRLDGTPYVISETYLSGGPNDHAIVKLSPGKQGSNAHGNWYRDRVAELDDRDNPTG